MVRRIILFALAGIGFVFYTNCADLPISQCNADQRNSFYQLVDRNEQKSFDKKQDFISQAQIEDIAADFEAKNECDLGPNLEPATELEKQVKL